MHRSLRRHRSLFAFSLVAGVAGLSAFNALERPAEERTTGTAKSSVPESSFTNFESAHVHPIDMTPDGTKLLSVNTGNNSLEVFTITPSGLLHAASIPVGLDPVTVRARTDNEVWVVCQVSDEVSIVDLSLGTTVRSVLTENEPADVVFAGSPQKAFVSCAEQELVQVFDPADLNNTPTTVLLKGEQPRALAVSPDGGTVYCAFYESGNQTTVIPGNVFHAGGFCSVQGGACTTVTSDVTHPAGPYGGSVPVPNAGAGFNPPMNPNNPAMPGNHSLVVRKNAAGQWMDDNGGNWTNIVTGGVAGTSRIAGWDMPDRDVAMINANNPNTAGVTYKNHLGNILMAMAVHPSSGEVYVVGTDATNEVRFEPNLRGRFLRVNVARFAPGGGPVITDLNPHINYSTHSSPPAIRQQSVGDPRGIAWKADGSKAYVTGMGSNNVITITATGSRTAPDPIPVGEGPTGIVLDEAHARAYVLNKFDGSISTIDLVTDRETSRTAFFDPTPQVIKTGRKHLYNTHTGSGHGHISCGSCHVDARWDRLAWDLGNPSGSMVTVNDPAGNRTFHPMKGLKTTQFLVDIINRGTGKLHWRGDKGSFQDFAGAFEDLQGTSAPLDAVGMQEFANFLNAIWYVPNPYRTIRPDSSVAASVERMPGRVRLTGTTFQTVPAAGVRLFVAVNVNCSHCHQTGSGRGHLPGNGSNVSAGQVNMTNNTSMVPDLRTVYRKNGFFYNTTECTSGFGLMSDGVMETRFNNPGVSGHYFGDYEPELLSWSGGITQANSVQSHQFDLVHPVHDALPAVGMRMTLNGSVGSVGRVGSLRNWVNKYPTDYGLVVKGRWNGERRGFYYLGGDQYQPDQNGATPVTHAQLVTHAQAGNALTWTVVHPSTTIRHGVDRDLDGIYDYTDGDTELELTLLLEGPLQGSQMGTLLHTNGLLPTTDPQGSGEVMAEAVMDRQGAAAPVDWVWLELRDAANAGLVVDERPALVQANGKVVMADGRSPIFFPDAPRGNYYVAVRHRNHLGAMTSTALPFGPAVQVVDLSSATTATYGTDARKAIGNLRVLWAGDVSGDGELRYTNADNDRDPILARIGGLVPTLTVTGYHPEDVNLDGVVKYTNAGNDRDIILTNIGGAIPTSIRQEQLP